MSQISVGPTGLVWAVTWHGKALVRLGVTRLDPFGTSWSILEPPSPTAPLNMVAVGNHVVWATSRNRNVWFRNGVHGGGSGESEALARGVKWVGMVGEMVVLSVGPLDQVVGIQDDQERSIVIRTGVSTSDLSGKTWKIISAGISHETSDSFKHNPSAMRNLTANLRDEEPIQDAPDDTESKSNVTHGSSNAHFKGMAHCGK